MIHAVIDTNVLVSALLTSKSDTATVQVLEAIMNGQIIPLYNEEIISEYEIVFPKTPIVVTPAQIMEILRNTQQSVFSH